jgi:hypothetical protein
MYLQFKRANGTPIERKVYSKLDFVGMVERLISKRPLSFYGAHDKYLLRNGTKGSGKWELIGQEVNNWDSWSGDRNHETHAMEMSNFSHRKGQYLVAFYIPILTYPFLSN